MKIAIPVFNFRISPRFDFSQELLVVDVADGAVVRQEKISTRELSSIEKTKTILDLGVDVVICGGIDCYSMWRLKSHQLMIFAWLAGDAQETLSRFLADESAFRFRTEPSQKKQKRRRVCQGKDIPEWKGGDENASGRRNRT